MPRSRTNCVRRSRSCAGGCRAGRRRLPAGRGAVPKPVDPGGRIDAPDRGSARDQPRRKRASERQYPGDRPGDARQGGRRDVRGFAGRGRSTACSISIRGPCAATRSGCAGAARAAGDARRYAVPGAIRIHTRVEDGTCQLVVEDEGPASPPIAQPGSSTPSGAWTIRIPTRRAAAAWGWPWWRPSRRRTTEKHRVAQPRAAARRSRCAGPTAPRRSARRHRIGRMRRSSATHPRCRPAVSLAASGRHAPCAGLPPCGAAHTPPPLNQGARDPREAHAAPAEANLSIASPGTGRACQWHARRPAFHQMIAAFRDAHPHPDNDKPPRRPSSSGSPRLPIAHRPIFHPLHQTSIFRTKTPSGARTLRSENAGRWVPASMEST